MLRIALCLALAATAAPSAPPRDLLHMIDTIDRTAPLSRARVEQLIGKKLACKTPGACDAYNIQVGATKIGHVDSRLPLLGLAEISGVCVPVTTLMQRYPGGQIVNACTDGATCMTYVVKRRWGRLWVELPKDGATTGCTTSVYFN